MGTPAALVQSLVAVAAEASYDTPTNRWPGATDFRSVPDDQDASLGYEEPRHAYADRWGSRSRRGALPGEATSDWSLPLLLRGAGSAGSTPDDGDLVQAAGFGAPTVNTTDAVQSTPTPTLTSYAIATASNVAARSFVLTAVSGADYPELRWCLDNTAGTLTVAPPHSQAPTAGDAVTATVTYALSEALGTSLAMWRYFRDHTQAAVHAEHATGLVVQAVELGWSTGDRAPMLTFSGPGSGHVIRTGVTTLGAAAGSTDTTLTLDELGAVQVGSVILVDSEAAQVTAKSADTGSGTCTVTRGVAGTSAASHSSGATVRPYVPTPTFTADLPIRATRCDVFVDGAKLRARNFRVRMEQTIELLRDASGTRGEYATGFVPGLRTVTFEAEVVLEDAAPGPKLRALAAHGGNVSVFIQLGDAAGRVVGVCLPEVYLEAAPSALSGDGPAVFQLVGEARATSGGSGADEIYIGWG